MSRKKIMKPQKLLSDFSSDMLLSFAEHLALSDYMNFRAVCRACRLALPPRWKSPRCSYPLLICWEKELGICRLFDPFQHSKSPKSHEYLIKIPDELLDSRILCSNDSWLLLSGHQGRMFFWNPFQKEIIQLPTFTGDQDITRKKFSFSFAPSSPDCLVVGISASPGALSISFIRSPYQKEWCHQMVRPNGFPVHWTYCRPVFHNGAIYLTSRQGHLCRLELTGENAISSSCPALLRDQHFLSDAFLLDYCGDLLLIEVNRSAYPFGIGVYRWDASTNIWVEEVRDLASRAMFLGKSSSFAVPMEIPGHPNRMYLPECDSLGILYFSVDKGNYHFCRGEQHRNRQYPRRQCCAWVLVPQ